MTPNFRPLRKKNKSTHLGDILSDDDSEEFVSLNSKHSRNQEIVTKSPNVSQNEYKIDDWSSSLDDDEKKNSQHSENSPDKNKSNSISSQLEIERKISAKHEKKWWNLSDSDEEQELHINTIPAHNLQQIISTKGKEEDDDHGRSKSILQNDKGSNFIMQNGLMSTEKATKNYPPSLQNVVAKSKLFSQFTSKHKHQPLEVAEPSINNTSKPGLNTDFVARNDNRSNTIEDKGKDVAENSATNHQQLKISTSQMPVDAQHTQTKESLHKRLVNNSHQAAAVKDTISPIDRLRWKTDIDHINAALSPLQQQALVRNASPTGSGVLLEGWLKQKQRRGPKGMKKWNRRYFVLYAKAQQIRYYSDVIQAAWGPIPIDEIGSISFRQIHYITRQTNPKANNGCRFDITCRHAWGTHYADDYISSDEDIGVTSPASATTGNKVNERNPEGKSSPVATRVYSLIADTPQLAITWTTVLDMLLHRSANSPRIDKDQKAPTVQVVGAANKMQHLKTVANISQTDNNSEANNTTQSTKTADVKVNHEAGEDIRETIVRKLGSGRVRKLPFSPDYKGHATNSNLRVLGNLGDKIPVAVTICMEYLFHSTPGIETPNFYLLESEEKRLSQALSYLNQYASERTNETPSKSDLETLLDPITAGAVIKLWLQQLDQPIVPYQLYASFAELAKKAKTSDINIQRRLKKELAILPPKRFTILECLVLHLNDVSMYANKNGMDDTILAKHFTNYIFRQRNDIQTQGNEGAQDYIEMVELVKIMIDDPDGIGMTEQ